MMNGVDEKNQPGRLLGNPAAQKTGRLKTQVARAGAGFFLMMLCGFLMSVNFSNNLIFAMTFLLSGIALVGWWQTRWNLAGLKFKPWKCEPVFAGQDVRYISGVENFPGRERFGVSLEAPGSTEVREAEFDSLERMEVRRAAPVRGLLGTVSVNLKSTFPVGLFCARFDLEDLPECLVFPKPGGEEPLPRSLEGEMAHLGRESDNFSEMRRYAPGDPLSRISWQAWARTGELYTKEFEGAEGSPALFLRLEDVRASALEDKISQLCRWILDAHRQGRDYGLDLPGARIQPGNDDSHRQACLKALALYGNQGASRVGHD